MYKKSIMKNAIAVLLAVSMLSGCTDDSAIVTDADSTVSIKDIFNEKREAISDEDDDVSEETNDTDEASDNSKEEKQANQTNQYVPYIRDRQDFQNDDTNVYSQTVMVYMVGSDLESEYGNATADLTEMMKSNPDTENNNIVVLTGGASEWHIKSISGDNSYILELSDSDFHVKESLDSCNMGEADSLSNFVTYCLDEYDTDKYSLILWNHGAGPVMGFGIDENYLDILTLPELQKAMEDSVGKSGKKLEWIGFDACLMNSLEVADVLSPYANYLIASQETEPGWGWNYEFMSHLSDPGMNGAGMGKVIIDSYMDFYNDIFEKHPRYYADITLSCIDLNAYDKAEKALDAFFADIDRNLDNDTFPSIVRDRNHMRSFGVFSTDYDYSMVDSMSLISRLSDKADSDRAAAALDALNDMIVYDQSNLESANGISICFPHNSEDIYQEAYLKVQDNIDFTPGYSRFLKDVYALENGESIINDWDVSDAEVSVEDTAVTEGNVTIENGKEITLQLTDEQQKNFGKASFMILANAQNLGYNVRENDNPPDDIFFFSFGSGLDDENTDHSDNSPEDLYFYVYVGKNVTMDEEGRLHAYYANNLLYMKDTSSDGDGSTSHIPMILIDTDITNSSEKRYFSYAILSYIGDSIESWNVQNVELQIVKDAKHPNGYVRSAVPLDNSDESDIHHPSKELIDLNDYNIMEVSGSSARYVTRDSNGKLLPYLEWESANQLMGISMDISNGVEFVSQPIPDPENYMCIFTICDAQGNITSSELIPLK